MSFFSKGKRKNGDPQSFRFWPIIVVILVLAAFLLGTQVNSRQADLQFVIPSQNLELTATYMVEEATAQAQGTFQLNQLPTTLDPLEMTVTYIVGQATAIAQGTLQSGQSAASNLDPLEMTATALIKWATGQAGTPNS